MFLKKTIRGYLADLTQPQTFGKRVITVFSKALYAFVDYRKAFSVYEKLFRLVDADKAKKVSVLSYRYSTHRYIRKRSSYDKQVWMVFEDTMLPAPSDTHDALVCYFGEDYMTPKHLPTDHGERYLDATRPYTVVVEELKQHPELFEERIKLLYTE